MQLKKIQIDRQNLLKYYTIILYSLLIINLKNENTPYIFFFTICRKYHLWSYCFLVQFGFFFFILTPFPLSIWGTLPILGLWQSLLCHQLSTQETISTSLQLRHHRYSLTIIICVWFTETRLSPKWHTTTKEKKVKGF